MIESYETKMGIGSSSNVTLGQLNEGQVAEFVAPRLHVKSVADALMRGELSISGEALAELVTSKLVRESALGIFCAGKVDHSMVAKQIRQLGKRAWTPSDLRSDTQWVYFPCTSGGPLRVSALDPTAAFALTQAAGERASLLKVEPVEFHCGEKPCPESHIRVVCISDTHGRHHEVDFQVPHGDVLIHAGDFSNTGSKQDTSLFLQWMKRLPHKTKIVIAGNHDITMHEDYYENVGYQKFHRQARAPDEKIRKSVRESPDVIYLEDSGYVIDGYKFWGSPWQPEFCEWAFNLPRGEKCGEKWAMIPSDTDILITHGPALGHGDLCSSGMRAGCVNLLQHIVQRVKPLYHIAGHIHEGYGVTSNGETTFINASTCNFAYKPCNRAVVFDLPRERYAEAAAKVEACL